MKKRMYNAPEITVIEIVASQMIAASPDNKLTDGSYANINKGTLTTEDAGTARTASRQYFDASSEDEEW